MTFWTAVWGVLRHPAGSPRDQAIEEAAQPGDDAPVSSRPPLARQGRPLRAARRLLSLAAENAEGAVYGAVLVGVLFAAEDARRVGYPETIAAAAVVLALYWLSSFYAHNLGVRLQTREAVNVRVLWRSCLHELTIMEGGSIPVLVVLVAWAVGASVTGGVTAAVWATAVAIVALEVAAGWRARLRPRRRWLQVGVGVVMASAIIGLKLILY